MTTSKPQTIAYPAPGSRPHRHDDSRWIRTSSCCSARRATWPGASCFPGWPTWTSPTLAPHIEVVGTSLEDISDDEFRALAKEAIDEFGTHKLTDEQWDAFAETLTYVPQGAGPEALAAGGQGGRGEARGRTCAGCTTFRCRRRPPAPSSPCCATPSWWTARGW